MIPALRHALGRLALLATLAGGVTIGGCSGANDALLSPHGFLGAELPTTVPKPDFTFTDSRGQPYSLAQATAGKVTLLFFGYTHCPDVCPVHLANLAAVLAAMPDSIQSQVVVVFITTDPARDTPAVLDSWVKGFDPHFVGLTGSDSVIAAAQRTAQVLLAVKDTTDSKGNYGVGHAAQVIAYTRDGIGRVEYPPGTRQRDWAHDLPLLVAYGNTPGS
ncbi:MAG TPA: SCO family protein [Gemmatimonadales bacterium]|nr:SCO family protein [Gemmatimonadales bacterium]